MNTRHCIDDATEQFVWVDIDTGVHKISPPLCEGCSEDSQPAETILVLELIDPDLACQGPFDAG